MHRNNCDCDSCFKIGGDPGGLDWVPPSRSKPLDEKTLNSIVGDIVSTMPKPPQNIIKKEGNVDRKLNMWGYVKWIWNFNPILWLVIIGIIIPVAVGMASHVLAGLITFIAEAGIIILGFVFWAFWRDFGNDIKNHCRKWWNSRPQ